jgi:hypothetical protein
LSQVRVLSNFAPLLIDARSSILDISLDRDFSRGISVDPKYHRCLRTSVMPREKF